MLRFLLKSALLVGATGLLLEGLKTLEEKEKKDQENPNKPIDIPDNMPVTPTVRPGQEKKPSKVSKEDSLKTDSENLTEEDAPSA